MHVPHKMIGPGGSGREGDQGSLWHAVPAFHGDSRERALCGVRPGPRSAGWSNQAGALVTCRRCLKRKQKEDK